MLSHLSTQTCYFSLKQCSDPHQMYMVYIRVSLISSNLLSWFISNGTNYFPCMCWHLQVSKTFQVKPTFSILLKGVQFGTNIASTSHLYYSTSWTTYQTTRRSTICLSNWQVWQVYFYPKYRKWFTTERLVRCDITFWGCILWIFLTNDCISNSLFRYTSHLSLKVYLAQKIYQKF